MLWEEFQSRYWRCWHGWFPSVMVDWTPRTPSRSSADLWRLTCQKKPVPLSQLDSLYTMPTVRGKYNHNWSYSISSVQFSRSVVSDSLWHHESQHARPPCPSPAPGVHPNPRPSSQWCHPAISSSVVPFFSCPQSFLASGSFQMSQLIASGGQSIGVSASTSSFQWTLISFRMDCLGLLAVQGTLKSLLNTTVQKHHFFGTQLSLWSNSHTHTWPLEKP